MFAKVAKDFPKLTTVIVLFGLTALILLLAGAGDSAQASGEIRAPASGPAPAQPQAPQEFEPAWIRHFGDEMAETMVDLVADPAGNIVFAGIHWVEVELGGDTDWIPNVLLASYDPAGNLRWQREVGTLTLADRPAKIVADFQGNIYMAGKTADTQPGCAPGCYRSIWLAKYDQAGVELWQREFAPAEVQEVYGLLIDNWGGIVLAGDVFAEGRMSVWASSYDYDGQLQWYQTYGAEGSNRYLQGIAPAADGGVYLAGSTDANNYDIFVEKVDNNGARFWALQFGTETYEEIASMAVDSTHNVYLAGITYGELGGPNAGSSDIWASKISAAGDPMWHTQFGSDSGESPHGIDVNMAGNVHLTGATGGDLGGTNQGYSDVWVARLALDGTPEWVKQFGTEEDDTPLGETYMPGIGSPAIISDNLGRIFVAGITEGSLEGANHGFDDIWQALYTADGEQVGLHQFGSVEHDYIGGMTTDRADNLILAGESSGELFARIPDEPAGGGEPENIWVARTNSGKAWTLLFYLAMDNDLDDQLMPIFDQLEMAAVNAEVNIMAFWDGAVDGDSAYYLVQPDYTPGQTGFYREGETLWSHGELNSGESQTLSDFIDWSMASFAADHYALVLDDHGSGLGGGLVDSHSGSTMTLREMQEGVDTGFAGRSDLDLLYLNQCLMSMLEVAYQFRGLTDYLVAGEDLLNAFEDPYLDYVGGIEDESTPGDVALMLVNGYADAADAYDYTYALSAVEMAGLDGVVAATNDLALALAENLDLVVDDLAFVREDVQRFDVDCVAAGCPGARDGITPEDDNIDLYHFAELVGQYMDDQPAIVAAAGGVMDALDDYVLLHRSHSADDYDLGNSHGVAIFFPAIASSFYNPANYDFAVGADWPGGGWRSASGTGGDIAWGPLMVDYFETTAPGGPDNPNPPVPVPKQPPEAGATRDIFIPLLWRR